MENEINDSDDGSIPGMIPSVLEEAYNKTLETGSNSLEKNSTVHDTEQYESYFKNVKLQIKPEVSCNIIDEILDPKQLIRDLKTQMEKDDMKNDDNSKKFHMIFHILMVLVNERMDELATRYNIDSNILNIYEFYIKVFMKFLVVYESKAAYMLNNLLNEHLKLSRFTRMPNVYRTQLELYKTKNEEKCEQYIKDVETFLFSLSVLFNSVSTIDNICFTRFRSKVEVPKSGKQQYYSASFSHYHKIHMVTAEFVKVQKKHEKPIDMLQLENVEGLVLLEKLKKQINNDNLNIYENISCCTPTDKRFINLYSPASNKKEFKIMNNMINEKQPVIIMMQNLKLNMKLYDDDTTASVKVYPCNRVPMLIVDDDDEH